MRISCLIVLCLFLCYTVKSQTDEKAFPKNAFYLEFGGIGGLGSLNYERMIPLKGLFAIGLRAGLSTSRIKDYMRQFNPDIIIPIAVHGLFGKNHKLEVGFGQVFSNTILANALTGNPERISKFHANFTMGYRYQKSGGRLLLRCGYMPLIESYRFYRHWAGAAIGYVF